MTQHDVASSPGGYLRALRDARQGSLEEMARATRVSTRQLAALESDNFSELPAPVFVKGFIRAYCHFLGEPPADALRRYGDLLGERPAPERGAPGERRRPPRTRARSSSASSCSSSSASACSPSTWASSVDPCPPCPRWRRQGRLTGPRIP